MLKKQLPYPVSVQLCLHLSIWILDLVNRAIKSFVGYFFKLKYTVQKSFRKIHNHSNENSVLY